MLHLIGGGLLGLLSASLAASFGWRAADRLPGESRWPECVFCLRPYRWFEIFPLLGWLSRRKASLLPCPCGKRKKLWAQPATELAGFGLGFAAMIFVGGGWGSIPLCLGLGILPALALIDLHFGIIPDELNFVLAICGFSWAWLSGADIWLCLITAALLLILGLFFALVYSRWRGKEMLGLGDVKFFTAAGLWLPPHLAPWFLAGAGIIGIIFSFIWRRISEDREFPFAPALCFSLVLCVFYQLIIIMP